MKNFFAILSLVIVGSVGIGASRAHAADWKGTPTDGEWSVGGLTGMGIISGSVGFSVLGTASKRIINPGFVADLNNTVHAEVELGPIFISGVTGFAYNAQLRWNFEKDQKWTLFAIGGFGGNNVGGGSQFFPRFGMGAMYTLSPVVKLRGQISHDLIAIGVNIPLG